jgi:hypothetical protein
MNFDRVEAQSPRRRLGLRTKWQEFLAESEAAKQGEKKLERSEGTEERKKTSPKDLTLRIAEVKARLIPFVL